MKLKELLAEAQRYEKKNRATLLVAFGIADLWLAIGLAFKAGVRVDDILQRHREELLQVDPEDKPARKAVVVQTGKELVPAVAKPLIFASTATACVIGSNSILNQKIATISAAYTLADTTLREYKEKVTEVLGEGKAQKVREAISKDHVQESPPPEDETAITRTGRGEVLCYDEYTDRYFYSCAEAIGEAIVKLSYDVQSEMWVDLNDLYFELGLKPCKMGRDLGFHVDHTDRGRIPVYYTATLTDDKRPCLAIQFDVDVRERFA